jgi:hypothetical protein
MLLHDRSKQDKHCAYSVNIELRSRNHFLQWKGLLSLCVFVALGIHHTIRMRHIAIFGMFGSTAFFRIIVQMARFSAENVIERKMRVLIFSAIFV